MTEFNFPLSLKGSEALAWPKGLLASLYGWRLLPQASHLPRFSWHGVNGRRLRPTPKGSAGGNNLLSVLSLLIEELTLSPSMKGAFVRPGCWANPRLGSRLQGLHFFAHHFPETGSLMAFSLQECLFALPFPSPSSPL